MQNSLKLHFQDTNQIGFGFEETPKGYIYKVYFEYWDKIISYVNNTINNKTPQCLHIGYKWYIDNPSMNTVTKYMTYPMLSNNGIREKLTEVYSTTTTRPKAFTTTNRILNLAESKASDKAFLFVTATEDNNPRTSFDINFYKANLTMGKISSFIEGLYKNYTIPEESNYFDRIKNKPFGHIAGGIDRNGEDFMTFYYSDSMPV